MNFLYALVGALEDRPRKEVAKTERGRLLTELEGCEEFEALMEEGKEIET